MPEDTILSYERKSCLVDFFKKHCYDSKMRGFLSQVIANIVGLWLAGRFISGVIIKVIPGESDFFGIPLAYQWQVFVLLGLILALLNYFLRPLLGLITLPLQILSLGVLSLIISMAMIWLLDLFFAEFTITGIIALFWATLIIWGINLIVGYATPKKRR